MNYINNLIERLFCQMYNGLCTECGQSIGNGYYWKVHKYVRIEILEKEEFI